MNSKTYDVIRAISGELYYKALTKIPPDTLSAISKAINDETFPTARQILALIKKNIEIAENKNRIVCQDTGTPVFFVKISNLEISVPMLEDSIRMGVRDVTQKFNLRPNMVHPISRVNSGDNTGYRSPEVITEFLSDTQKYIEITALPKGSGSENMGTVKMLSPSDGLIGVKKFVLEWIAEIGGKGCPPYVVGIGLGGTLDQAARFSKIAIFRPLNERNQDPDIADLESELLMDINKLGIGPMGLGGDVTAIGVNIEYGFTHISSLPVAINIQCWRNERATALIDENLKVHYR
ncbi:MAG: fumarate hydratase [Thermoplasmatales archaeon]